ncbi:MAG: GTPase SAR1 family protein [Polaribacter sp.]|jgi:GTPase SAR1 family protein
MSDWNPTSNILTLKIVYYGPALSGKTTNLIALHDLLQPSFKGDMQILETKDDRTLFFDLFPLGLRTSDNTLIKLKIYTVPGQVVHNSTRKAVLSRCDGIVFVADSQLNQSENNAESFNNLAQNIRLLGLNLKTLPLFVQFNKRDLPAIESIENIEKRWSETPWQVQYASALNKDGVYETFIKLLELVYRSVDKDYHLMDNYKLTESSFIQQLTKGDQD